MINKSKIYSSIAEARASLRRLRQLSALSAEEFCSDPDNYAICEHHLRRVIEILLDTGRHIIAKQALGKPKDYTEILDILGQASIIPMGFASEIRGLAGYRNRLVHMYHDVTREELYSVITTRIDTLDDFCKYILQYLEAM